MHTGYISPHSEMVTFIFGLVSALEMVAYLLFGPVGTFSILRTVNMPSVTRPKTVCLPSKNSAGAVVMKNWQPFVPGPEFAWSKFGMTGPTIDSSPGLVCLT